MTKASGYLAVAAIGCTIAGVALAAGPSKEEKQATSAIASVDKAGSEPNGEQQVVSRLEARFNVDQARIDNLRSQNLGFGEIAIVLALAQKMTGGITDANVLSIMSLRTGTPPLGWGEIARKLGEKLGPVVSEVNAVARDVRQEMARAERPEKADRPDRPIRPERPDHPEKPIKP